MNKVVIYVHGKGGNPQEAEDYGFLFSGYDVLGMEYKSQSPDEAEKEFKDYWDKNLTSYSEVILIANSIGACFSLYGFKEEKIKKAFFISPIVDMESLILSMLSWSGSSLEELKEKKEIPTEFGETLSWDAYLWVKAHPVRWEIPTEVLYGEKDTMQSIESIQVFCGKCSAGLTIMKEGEHWFHTREQMNFLFSWIKRNL